MKVLLSAFACEPYKGTELGNGWNWALNTTKLGYEVWCLTTIEGKEAIDKEVERLQMPNLHIVYVKVPKILQSLFNSHLGFYPYYIYWQQLAYKKAKELDKHIGFDLVHHVTIGSLQMGTALWRLNKPLIFGPAGGGQEAPPAFKKYFYGWWKMEVLRSWVSRFLLKVNPDVRKSMKQASLVLATNEDTYLMAKGLGATNPKLFLDTSLPEEFFPAAYPERAPDKELKILWVGRLFARKGLPLVLEALSHVNSDVRFKLTILGDGHLHDMVPELIKTYNLEGKVDWKGQVPWQTVQEAYSKSDLFMFCSLRDSSAAQLLEAMAYGLPILTLDLHGAKNLVPDNAGIKVSVSSPDETVQKLARAVEELYYNPELRAKMGKAGYSFAKTQTWPLKTKQINSLYEQYGLAETQELSYQH